MKPQPTLKMSAEFMRIVLPMAAILLIIFIFHFRFFTQSETSKLLYDENITADLLNQVVTTDMENVISDTQLLADYFQKLMSANLTIKESSRQLLTQFLLMSKHKRLYDHIRMLDLNGNEITRVNFNNGSPLVVPKAHLQNKSNRYYFQAIKQLAEGKIYISPMDLNVEGEKIEQPIKPTIRFGMTLYRDSEKGKQSEKMGVLILNYDARKLITRFKKVASSKQDHIMLVNHQGYWLISPKPDNAWGFMFDNELTFKQNNPVAWQHISKQNEGQVETEKGLFLFTTVTPYSSADAKKNKDRSQWKIISHLNAKQLNIPVNHFVKQYLSIYFLLTVICLVASAIIARYRVIHRKSELHAAYESRFRQTLEDIQLIAVTIDTTGRITFCNDRLLELTGFTHENVIGENWYELFIPVQQGAAERQFINSVLEKNEAPTIPHESIIVDNKQQSHLVSWSTTPIQNPDNQPIGITLIGDDITEKRQNEEQLQTLSRAVEQSPSTVMITNTKGVIEFVNNKFEELTGYTVQEVVGQKPSILKSGFTTADEYKDLWKTVWEGNTWKGALKNRKKNGEFYWEKAIIAPVRNSSGKIIHFISLKEDITEKKQLAETLEERNQEILRNRELAAVGKMANMIAHDLRNPLSSIKLSLQMIDKHSGQHHPEQMKELSSISLDQIRYMEAIITDVMNYSKPDKLMPSWLSMPHIVDDVLAIMQKTIDDHKAHVSTHIQTGLPTLYADQIKLKQVLSNLIANAIQSTESNTNETSKVVITAQLLMAESGRKIKIDITDNGLGIDPCITEKVFDPFYTKKAKGTGLGLAIVKRYVEQHEGKISLTPVAKGGTCATLILPVMPEVSDTARALQGQEQKT